MCKKDPGPGMWQSNGFSLQPIDDMWYDWSMAWEAGHPAFAEPALEPALQCAVEFQASTFATFTVVDEIRQLVEDWQTTADKWYQELHLSVQRVYTANDTKLVTQVPVLTHLLELCGHGGVDDLFQKMTGGFRLVGPLGPGTGWLPRVDERLSSMSRTFNTYRQNWLNDAPVNTGPPCFKNS